MWCLSSYSLILFFLLPHRVHVSLLKWQCGIFNENMRYASAICCFCKTHKQQPTTTKFDWFQKIHLCVFDKNRIIYLIFSNQLNFHAAYGTLKTHSIKHIQPYIEVYSVKHTMHTHAIENNFFPVKYVMQSNISLFYMVIVTHLRFRVLWLKSSWSIALL